MLPWRPESVVGREDVIHAAVRVAYEYTVDSRLLSYLENITLLINVV